jgi:pSer/pThr/pTyr-binding forkhead associated (FHA) protein
MTTQAPPHPSEQIGVGAPAGAATTPLSAPDSEATLDSLHLLDHRARRRAIPDQLAPAGHYLAFQDGDETRLLRLESAITHLGRSLTSDLRFEDQRISRTHAIIVRHGRYARVLDNRSANGTFLNGRRIIASNLEHGDVVRVGPIAMQYLEIR